MDLNTICGCYPLSAYQLAKLSEIECINLSPNTRVEWVLDTVTGRVAYTLVELYHNDYGLPVTQDVTHFYFEAFHDTDFGIFERAEKEVEIIKLALLLAEK